jgi:UPF0755 protein
MIKKATIVLFMLAVFLTIFAALHFFASNEKKLITVQSGDNFIIVASHLKEQKIIYSENLFLALVKLTKSQNKLKVGLYEFSQKDNMFKIWKELKNGSNNVLRITVPEGSNIKQTSEIISKTVNIDKGKFIKLATEQNLEGYLMPETYFVSYGMGEEQLISMMRNEFDKKITPSMYERAKELGISFKDAVIMASIVEKEAIKPQEKSIIAAVFYNRLKKNMRLQSCATVLYAMGVNKIKLTVEDTKFISPYNTYIHFGIPPGPICSPGIESIKAVLYPADTSNLFFVSDAEGNHLFAENFDEHKKNKCAAILKQRKKE